MSNYYNEAGEPLMDGAAMRYEMYLDSTYEPDPYDDYDDYDEPEACEDYDHACNDCNGPGGVWDRNGVFTPNPGQVWHCAWCDRPCPEGAHDD